MLYPKEAGFEAAQIHNMFETFKRWNLAMRSYSSDWRNVWFDWIHRESSTPTSGTIESTEPIGGPNSIGERRYEAALRHHAIAE
jgi:hypothetical protein